MKTKTKKSNIKEWRDLMNTSELDRYADKEGLNMETHENCKEAAQALFEKKYASKKKVKRISYNLWIDIEKHVEYTDGSSSSKNIAVNEPFLTSAGQFNTLAEARKQMKKIDGVFSGDFRKKKS